MYGYRLVNISISSKKAHLTYDCVEIYEMEDVWRCSYATCVSCTSLIVLVSIFDTRRLGNAISQRLLFLSRGRSLAPVDVMRLEKAVPCFPHTCSGVKCFRFFDCFSAAKLQLQTARSRQELSQKYLVALSQKYLVAKFGWDM